MIIISGIKFRPTINLPDYNIDNQIGEEFGYCSLTGENLNICGELSQPERKYLAVHKSESNILLLRPSPI